MKKVLIIATIEGFLKFEIGDMARQCKKWDMKCILQ